MSLMSGRIDDKEIYGFAVNRDSSEGECLGSVVDLSFL